MNHFDANPFRPPAQPDAVRIVPLGGCGEFGMNLTAFLTGGKLFVVDCGVRFPDPAKLGIDAVLPNVDPWFREVGGVFAYILTHGHEDHIGAVPYILPRWPAPVYGTAWTMELVRNKLVKLGYDPNAYKLVTVEAGSHVATAGFDVEYVHINHSIPMACSLMIRTPGLNIFHTGDFKFEDDPVIEKPTDFQHLAALADEGVDLLLADSTNSEKNGHCPPEKAVFEPLRDVISGCPGAAILTTFSSNLWRLKTIADVCIATGRKLYITGNGIESTLTIAKNTGLYHLPENLRVAEDQLSTFPRERLVVLATGCQGEWRSAMARMAAGEHKSFRVGPGDTVILSSRIIPGNEKAILGMTNLLLKAGARIVTTREAPGIHVSGHAYGGDLDRLVRTLRPRHFLPVHGAFSQLRANLERPSAAGLTTSGRLVETGDVLEATKDGVTLVGRLEVDLCFVDADSRVMMSYETLRQRLRVGELGSALVTGVYSREKEAWLASPEITLTGLNLPFAVDERAWLDRLARTLSAEVARLLVQKRLQPDEVSEEIRILVRRQLNGVLKKKPVVAVKLHFV